MMPPRESNRFQYSLAGLLFVPAWFSLLALMITSEQVTLIRLRHFWWPNWIAGIMLMTSIGLLAAGRNSEPSRESGLSPTVGGLALYGGLNLLGLALATTSVGSRMYDACALHGPFLAIGIVLWFQLFTNRTTSWLYCIGLVLLFIAAAHVNFSIWHATRMTY